ncbi:MAG: hypothetical protein MHPSP_000205, partial [Paramarteilia canceri]
MIQSINSISSQQVQSQSDKSKLVTKRALYRFCSRGFEAVLSSITLILRAKLINRKIEGLYHIKTMMVYRIALTIANDLIDGMINSRIDNISWDQKLSLVWLWIPIYIVVLLPFFLLFSWLPNDLENKIDSRQFYICYGIITIATLIHLWMKELKILVQHSNSAKIDQIRAPLSCSIAFCAQLLLLLFAPRNHHLYCLTAST